METHELIEQLPFFILGPPTIAIIWRLMARGWAMAVQGGTVSERSKQREKKLFWGMLIFMYVFNFGAVFYAYFIKEN
jgi:hypothetical protein